PLLSKGHAAAVTQQAAWRELVEQRFADDEVQAGVTSRQGMADPVAFVRVEEKYLVGLGHGIVSAEMPDEDTAIGKRHVRVGRAFLLALMPAAAGAANIPDRDERRLQQRPSGKVRHCSPTIMDCSAL